MDKAEVNARSLGYTSRTDAAAPGAPPGTVTHVHRAPRRHLLVATLLLAACGGGGSSSVVPPSPPDLLATATIGPAGGTLEAPAGPHQGVQLTVLAGAVSTPTTFTIRVEADEDAVPSVFPVYRFEPADRDFPADRIGVTVRGAASLFSTTSAPTLLTMFRRQAAGQSLQVLPDVAVNELTQTATAAPTRLGRFFASTGDLQRVFSQDFQLLDPAVPTTFQTVYGIEVLADNGAESTPLGRGSLASFWSSTAAENVLVLHGLTGSPLDFRYANDLAGALDASVQNVVFLAYPSATGVAANANRLYDLLRQHAQPGFGCRIVGHSLGGLLARYLLERSRQDPDRTGFTPGDPEATTWIDRVILLGTPNAGSNTAGSLFASMLPALPPSDQRFLQSGLDVIEGPDTFTAALNAGYVDNPARYLNVYGDYGVGSDGIVSVAAATALPLTSPEESQLFPTTHPGLHTDAAWNGIAAWVNSRLLAP